MNTVEILFMSGVLRDADFKPPRPTRSFSGGGLPHDALWTESSTGVSEVTEDSTVVPFVSRSWWKELWLPGR